MMLVGRTFVQQYDETLCNLPTHRGDHGRPGRHIDPSVRGRAPGRRARGVPAARGRELDPEALGYPVTAFLTLEIRQAGAERGDRGGHDAVARHLAGIPEVLEAFTITGAGDMWARVVAHSNTDLQRVIDAVLSDPGIVRSSTVIALARQVPYRVLPLLDA
jgi:DNA-binding Lrp family transcriptional regulator